MARSSNWNRTRDFVTFSVKQWRRQPEQEYEKGKAATH
jgi:hypothetical protein